MKVELVQGCTCDAYDVDGKSVVNFSTQELKELLKKHKGCAFYGVNFYLETIDV